MRKLSELKENEQGCVEGFTECCPLKIKRRMCDLGITKGEKVKILRKSLLKKVVLLEIRGYTLSLQRKISEFVLVR